MIPDGNPLGMKKGEERGQADYLFDNAEVIDWATPTGVFAVARRMDPELETFLTKIEGSGLNPLHNFIICNMYLVETL